MNRKCVLLFVSMTVAFCCASENRELVPQKNIGIFCTQNKREFHEDRFYHSAIDGGSLYAVYDGHLGSAVADFLAKNFHTYFCKASGSIRERIIEAFHDIDNDKEVKKNKHCGAAAAIVFIKNNVVHCAHVGDVRAVLEGDGKVAFFTRDHTPDRADEYVRIEDKKGAQFADTMKDFLILSRSFGDHGFNKDIIIVEPDYEEIALTEHHKFLVLATDGLWDFMSNEDVVEILNEKKSSIKDMTSLAKLLALFAVSRGSRDNITVMLVDLLS